MSRLREALFVLFVGTAAALALFFGAVHPVGIPLVLKFSWAFAVYFGLPLAGAVLLDTDKRPLSYVLGIAGAFAVLVPVVLRSYFKAYKLLFFQHPEYFVLSVMGGVALVLTAGAVGRARLSDWGLGPGDWRWWVPRTLVLLVLIVPLVLLAAWAFPGMREFYPIYTPAKTSFAQLLKYQAGMGVYMLSWEFLFRGFLLFGMARHGNKHIAVVLQALPFLLMHRGKPEAELVSSFFGALLLGYFCLRARSFWPAFGLHWALNFSMEVVGFLW